MRSSAPVPGGQGDKAEAITIGDLAILLRDQNRVSQQETRLIAGGWRQARLAGWGPLLRLRYQGRAATAHPHQ